MMNPAAIQVSVVMPGLNEQENIAAAVDACFKTFRDLSLAAELVVVDDGSADRTGEIVREKMREFPGRIRMIRHETPQGIGAAFWDGVDHACGEAVVLIPADNENDPGQILRYLSLLDHVDMVVPFVVNPGVRPLSRRVVSRLFTRIINISFGTAFHYTNGTVLYRRAALLSLDRRVHTFFFQADILVRLARKNHLFAEVPYMLNRRAAGSSKALSWKSLRTVACGYLRLLRDGFVR